jgi:hypothetical protein
MKKTLLGLLATAMLITACQKEAAAPTNEATPVPKCLEGEILTTSRNYGFIIRVTNAKIGASWKPTSDCSGNTYNGEIVDFKNKTFENVIELANGSKVFFENNPGIKINGTGSKLYFTIDSASIGNATYCSTTQAAVTPELWCYPEPLTKFCAKTISTTKCK